MDGQDRLTFRLKEIKDFSEEHWTSKDIDSWRKDIQTFEIEQTEENVSSTKIEMTISQIMSLYCLLKRAQARGHIFGNGIAISGIKKGSKTTAMQKVKLTQADAEMIVSTLEKEEYKKAKQVADAIQKYMNTTLADWGNEVTMKRFDIMGFTEENYFPITVDANAIGKEANDKEQSIYRLLNMSFTKALVNKANNKLVVGDIIETFIAHASDMAKYNTIALPVLDVIKVLNYKEKTPEGANINTRDYLDKAYGTKMKSYINQFLKDLNAVSESQKGTEIQRAMLRNYKASAVGANLQVALLQPLSYFRASYAISNKYLMSAIRRKPQIEKVKQECGIALWKSFEMFDTNVSRGLEKIIAGDNNVYDEIISKSMWLASHMDDVTWGYLYNACEDYVSDTTKLEGEKYRQAVNDKFRDIVYSTQVVDGTMTRSELMRSKNFAVQGATAFMSEPTIAYNMLYDCYTDFTRDQKKLGFSEAFKKNGKKIGTAVYAYMMGAIVESLLRGAISTIRRPKEDDDDTFWKRVLQHFIDEMIIFNKIPIAKDIVTIAQGNKLEKMEYGGIQTMYYAFKSLSSDIKDKKLSYKTIFRTIQGASQLSGVAGSNLLKDVVSIWNATVGKMFPNLYVKTN